MKLEMKLKKQKTVRKAVLILYCRNIMKKINLLLLFLLLACTLSAQDGISIFIGRANRYAAVELSDYKKAAMSGIQHFKPFLGRLLQTLWKRLGKCGDCT